MPLPDTDPTLVLIVYWNPNNPDGQRFVGVGGKFVTEYPDACKWHSLKDRSLQRYLRSLRAKGFVPTVVENYGTEDERIALR